MTEAMVSSSMSTRSDRELAETITTQQPAPINSDVIMLNTMIHSTANTSPLRITAAAMRRAGLLFGAGRTAGSGEFMTGYSIRDDPDFVVAGPETVQPSLKVARSGIPARSVARKESKWPCLAAGLAEQEVDRMRGNLPKLGLIAEGAFKDGQAARDGDNV
jgi:hypothetical protein